MQQVAGKQGFWRRAHASADAEARSCPSFKSHPTDQHKFRGSGPRRPATALKIPRGERRIGRSRRTTRRWMILRARREPDFVGTAASLTRFMSIDVTFADIVHTADAEPTR